MSMLSRRRFLIGGAAALGGLTLVRSPAARAVSRLARREAAAAGIGGDGKLRVYTIVVDGLSPNELIAEFMPQLAALADDGTRYATASAVMLAETIPNHVAMLTGTRAQANGVPANEIYDRESGEVRLVDRPEDITLPTVIDRLRAAGLTTATVVSKQYLYDVLKGRADHHWEPSPQIPASDHAPDAFTMEALLGILDEHDPQYAFVNLGDVDRSGHVDPTGNADLAALRTGALQDTDAQIRRLVTFLQDAGRWEATVLNFLADHSMDWSPPQGFVNLEAALAAEPSLVGQYALAQNGGADLVTYTGDPSGRAAALDRMRTVIAAVEGVASVADTADHHLGPKAGDLVAFAEDGYRFSDPDPWSNPIPGNHGHPTTLPIPFVVTGGAPAVRRGEVVEQVTASGMDAGPTATWLFDRAGGTSVASLVAPVGSPRTEAFTLAPAPSAPVAVPGSTPPAPRAVTRGADIRSETTPATGGGGLATALGVIAAGGLARALQARSTRVPTEERQEKETHGPT